jgi:hypothetical protein
MSARVRGRNDHFIIDESPQHRLSLDNPPGIDQEGMGVKLRKLIFILPL